MMIALAWCLSSQKGKFPWRVVLGGLGLQLLFAVLILKAPGGQRLFAALGGFFNDLLGFVAQGSEFMFSMPGADDDARLQLITTFAFGVLPTIVFFSSLMAILYHVGLMQFVVNGLALVMQKTLGTSGAETLSAAANIFVGQTEAPLVVRPYVGEMTRSELMVVMVGGFATIAGGVMAVYVSFGIDAAHLMTASVISAPAALAVAKIMEPEVEEPQTLGVSRLVWERKTANVLEAAAEGASAGMTLALNVAAMLIAFVALIAMANAIIGTVGQWCGYEADAAWTLQKGFGYVFAPFAWLMGIVPGDCYAAGKILGEKMVINEFIAYDSLAQAVEAEELSERSATIMTYALCGFANFSSIGIQLGGIGGIAPQRRSDLAQLGFRAMLGGTLAAFMTACIAAVLI